MIARVRAPSGNQILLTRNPSPALGDCSNQNFITKKQRIKVITRYQNLISYITDKKSLTKNQKVVTQNQNLIKKVITQNQNLIKAKKFP